MENPRTYGLPPFSVAVVHGGLGAPGSVAPVARELSSSVGVLEPLQTASSLDGQVDELRALLGRRGQPPFTLIGASWGAWLSFILAARHPALVARLFLVGSAPFEQRYVPAIMEARLARLPPPRERERVAALRTVLDDPAAADRDPAFEEFGALLSRADAYDPLPPEEVPEEAAPPAQSEIYRRVWAAAARLRADGALLALAADVRCPVVALHGAHDPHPADGVRVPLGRTLRDFRFVLLDRCGHEPWRERHARDRFYAVLREELRDAGSPTGSPRREPASTDDRAASSPPGP